MKEVMMNAFSRIKAVEEEDGYWVMRGSLGVFARAKHAVVRFLVRK